MGSTHKIKIDLFAERPDGSWILILVEEGPWHDERYTEELRRIQTRLYDCFDILVDGHLAKKYPESTGNPGIIRLDCYNLRVEVLNDFFQRFQSYITTSSEYQDAMQNSEFISSISFEIAHETLKEPGVVKE